jgi:hypothetical protein
MSQKLLSAILVSAALVAPGVALADPPAGESRNHGGCVSAENGPDEGDPRTTDNDILG